jgi:hypothetical protein
MDAASLLLSVDVLFVLVSYVNYEKLTKKLIVLSLQNFLTKLFHFMKFAAMKCARGTNFLGIF